MFGIRPARKQDYTHMGRAGDDLCTEEVMEVVYVGPGYALSKHNELQPDAAIHKGDVVLSVNGVHGDIDAMWAQAAKDSMVFEVERREAQVHALETLEVNETPGCFFYCCGHSIMSSQRESCVFSPDIGSKMLSFRKPRHQVTIPKQQFLTKLNKT